MSTIEGDAALAEFRAGLTGRRGLDLIRHHGGRVLARLPVGVGKSRWLDAITVEAIEGGDYDLVVVLAPTRRLIEERAPLRHPPAGVKVVNLMPRPSKMCGPERDAAWRPLETAESGALGRVEVCGRCPVRGSCRWPDQYGASLRGAGIIYATQAHLKRSPGFLARLRSWVGAKRVLTLFDEFDFGGKSFEVDIPGSDLRHFLDALRDASPACTDPDWDHARWLGLCEMLEKASTSDLQAPGWVMPSIRRDWALAVQRAGRDRFGEAFRFLGYRLAALDASPPESRRKELGGGLQFGGRPYVGDCLILSATAGLEFARHRLGPDIADGFAGHEFRHPGTRWYNLCSAIGTRGHFEVHLPQVLDFFAGLAARRIADGKRVLFVAKKRFIPQCAAGLEARFAKLGLDVDVQAGGWTEESLADPRAVPLINYGMIGTNLFESFDCAFCFTGYYVDEGVIDQCLQDHARRDLRLPLRIETVGDPRRRRAGVADPAHGAYDVARLAQPALEFMEHGAVVQAVGRVRPFTRPREVVTFQMAELPGVTYDREFRTLGEARDFFGVRSCRQRRNEDRTRDVAELRVAGLTQVQTAERLGISERTVRSFDRKRDRQ